MMDNIFTILCWIPFSLLSLGSSLNRGERRLRPDFASPLLIRVNVKKFYSLEYSVHSLIIEICLIVKFCSDIKLGPSKHFYTGSEYKITFKLKNVLLHDHSKR